ncbi:MAG TPA: chemotaxis protein CheA, partial [Candidatus Methylacidiphilales bacterium]|nr:chemotaxis protein CheA [Candidatus Methylacidiphilales bacterium]
MDADLPLPSTPPPSAPTSAEAVTLDIAGDGDLLAEFISEAREHLAEIEQGVLKLESNPNEDEALRGIFRAFHSFKGVAGYLNLAPIHDLAHELESVLDMVRHEKLLMDARVIQLILESKDVLEHFVLEIETRLKNPKLSASIGPILIPTAELEGRAREILASVTIPSAAPATASQSDTPEQTKSSAPAPATPIAQTPAGAAAKGDTGTPAARPVPPLFAQKPATAASGTSPAVAIPAPAFGSEPISGSATSAAPAEPLDPSAIPILASSPGTASGKTELPTVSDGIIAPTVALPLVPDTYEAAITAHPTVSAPLPSAQASPPAVPAPPRVTLPLDPSLPTASSPGVFSGPQAASSSPAAPLQSAQNTAANADPDAQSSGTTRVDVARLDTLVEYVRELSVVHSLIGQSIKELGVKNTRLTRYLTQMQRLSRELQRTSMAMRLVPLSGLFRRIQRVVRDLARREGKQINLVLSGDDTELDRTLVEQLADPLTHMVRNAVDHGIESPEERRLAGKSPIGTLRIEARHAGSQVVMRIADDGGGLDRDRILLKGIERGLVPPTAVLEREEIDQLIFAPGFTTTDVITEISGRGVGLDVVRQHIDSLRGQIDIESEPGRGTAFIITLPLTTSILDGMIVTVGAQRFIIPAPSVLRTFRPTPPQQQQAQRDSGYGNGGMDDETLSESGATRRSFTDISHLAAVAAASRRNNGGNGGSDSDQEPASLVSIHTDGTVYEMEGSRIAVIEVRGKLIPLVRVAEVLGVQALFRDATQGIVVLVEAEGREVALLVDRVVGKQEVVIKPLGETFRRNDLFAGASLLSDGVLSLVLNILAIARHT